MREKVHQSLSDSPFARWVALLLVSSTMFFAYMFVDVLAPIQGLLETKLQWSPDTFGTVGGSEFFLNVFVFFLIFAGIILDKMGVRFTALLAGSVMVLGASIKLYGVSDYFNNGGFGFEFFNSFLPNFPGSAKVACIGFAIFGCGVEMAGITVSKAIVKWFKGKELALAMGLEMAIARLGVFAVFRLSPYLAANESVSRPVTICTLLLLIGLLTFIIYFFLDKKLDKQTHAEKNLSSSESEDEFKISDLKAIFTSKTFLITAGLCVLFYSAIFPFQKFATGMLVSRLGLEPAEAAGLFSYFPIGAMILTPILGWFLDNKGRGATMLLVGSLLMTTCHLIFALTPASSFNFAIALCAIIILGVAFSLVPAALWPSVPKLVDNKVLGSAYSIIFWIQNIGLFLTPIVIGSVLSSSNPGIKEGNKNYSTIQNYQAYNSIKEIRTKATFVLEHGDDMHKLNAQALLESTQINIDNKQLAERVHKNILYIDSLFTNDISSHFLNSSMEINAAIATKDGEKTTSLLKDFDQFYTSLFDSKTITQIDRYIPMININYGIFNDTLAASKIDLLNQEYARIANTPVVNNSTGQTTAVHAVSATLFHGSDEISQNKTILTRLNPYNYKMPMLLFASLGIVAFLLGLWLKVEDKKKGFGLELPNIKK